MCRLWGNSWHPCSRAQSQVGAADIHPDRVRVIHRRQACIVTEEEAIALSIRELGWSRHGTRCHSAHADALAIIVIRRNKVFRMQRILSNRRFILGLPASLQVGVRQVETIRIDLNVVPQILGAAIIAAG